MPTQCGNKPENTGAQLPTTPTTPRPAIPPCGQGNPTRDVLFTPTAAGMLLVEVNKTNTLLTEIRDLLQTQVNRETRLDRVVAECCGLLDQIAPEGSEPPTGAAA